MQLSTPETRRAERLGWIVDQLSLTAVAKGQVFTPERLRINAEDLVDIPQEQLADAFNRARRELDYLPGVAEIRRLAGADEKTRLDAEARAAWDAVIKFVEMYVGCDAEGRYGPEHGTYGAWGPLDELTGKPRHPAQYPQLPQRILDVIRRTGGWIQYKRMTDQDMPFQQKRFFEEYTAWTAVELVTDFGRLLAMPGKKELPMPQRGVSQAEEMQPNSAVAALAAAKKMDAQRPRGDRLASSQLTPERKAELRRQLEEELTKRGIPYSDVERG
jgi:hypothetical protein